MMDIYFESNYGKLCEVIERGHCEVFTHSSSLGIIRHMFIKREIPMSMNGQTYYDLITPYGYRGPLILECENGKENELALEFHERFSQYCRDNYVVSEFVRFHPIVDNARWFGSCYDVSFVRYTVGTDLERSEDPLMEFSKSCRSRIRKALREGVTYRITVEPNNLDSFKRIYYLTMDRNAASEFYYFEDQYFEDCLALFRKNLILVEAVYQNTTIAAGLCFAYGTTLHVHLSGTLPQFLSLSPAYVLRYALSLWAKENGFCLIHHGGGRTNDANDNLYRFKKQFGNVFFEFSVGKKIWNEAIYWRLCAERRVPIGETIDFFPAYRYQLYENTYR